MRQERLHYALKSLSVGLGRGSLVTVTYIQDEAEQDFFWGGGATGLGALLLGNGQQGVLPQ